MSRHYSGSTSEGNGLEEQWKMESANRGDTMQASTGEKLSTAADAAKRVGGSVKDEASTVVTEVKDQASDLVTEAMSTLREQASMQQQRLADGARGLCEDFSQMADTADSGLAQTLVRQASQRADGVARWLDVREPGDLIDDVKTFARNRPGAFISVAIAAGILAGRLVRNSTGASASQTSVRGGYAGESDYAYGASGAVGQV